MPQSEEGIWQSRSIGCVLETAAAGVTCNMPVEQSTLLYKLLALYPSPRVHLQDGNLLGRTSRAMVGETDQLVLTETTSVLCRYVTPSERESD